MVKTNLFKMWLSRKWVMAQWWVVENLFGDVQAKRAEERDSYKWNLNRLNTDLDKVKTRNRRLQESNNNIAAQNADVLKRLEEITLKNLTEVLEHPRFLARIKDNSAEWMMTKMGADMQRCSYDEQETAYTFHQLAYTLVENMRTHVRTSVVKQHKDEFREQPVVVRIMVEPYEVAYCSTPYRLSALGIRAAK